MKEDTKMEEEEEKLRLSVFLPFVDTAKQFSLPLSEFKDTSLSSLFFVCVCVYDLE